MSENPNNEAFADNCPTDELPVLSEAAMAALEKDVPTLADAVSSETGEHRARLVASRPRVSIDAGDGADASSLAALTARWDGLESYLDKNAAALTVLGEQLAEMKQSLEAGNAAQERLIARLAEREPGFAAAAAVEDGERQDAADLCSSPDLDAYQSEIASLTAYIENRRGEWDELHATLAEHKTRIMELEQEVAQRAERQMQLEATVRDETERATALGGELASLKIELSRRPQGLWQRTAEGDDSEAALRAREQRIEELEARVATQAEALGDQRAQIEAQERALADAHAERDELEQRLAARSGRPFGEELADPELPAEEQSSRIAALQVEVTEKIDALHAAQEFHDGERTGEVVDLGARRSEDKPASDASRFTLVCLTSEESASYAIDKPETIIGRSDGSDIQIQTHVVSREHARLALDGERVVIEDLGSTNGIFINAVRVDRQALQHGDWVTIGETQFRFLDEGAT